MEREIELDRKQLRSSSIQIVLTLGALGAKYAKVYLMKTIVPVSFPVHIRLCTPQDLGALEWFGLFSADRKIFKAAFKKQVRGEGLMLLAEGNGQIVGQIWINLKRSAHRRTGFLWAFRVIPWLQGLGIGRALIDSAEDELRNRGFAFAELSVDTDNSKARAIYEKRGYSFAGMGDPVTYVDESGTKQRFYRWILRKDLVETEMPISAGAVASAA